MEAGSRVRPLAAVKVTVIQARPLMMLTSMLEPGVGSTIVAVAPVIVNRRVVAALPAPVVVTPPAVTLAFLNAPAENRTSTVPMPRSADPTL
jgi:hypothetical protein